MGWGNCGTDSQGRPIGYCAEGVCDFEGCDAVIDRGISYACGGMHGEDEHSCEKYFCWRHLYLVDRRKLDLTMGQLCPSCYDKVEGKKP